MLHLFNNICWLVGFIIILCNVAIISFLIIGYLSQFEYCKTCGLYIKDEYLEISHILDKPDEWVCPRCRTYIESINFWRFDKILKAKSAYWFNELINKMER